MSNITINSLPTASTIDGSLDILPIYTASSTATQGINRNTLLNLASGPVGLTDSQTLTNKTLTSPTINGATLSGTLSGTYTIGGTPTFPSSVTTLTGTQTLTNKTLTSPTINSPTITNATLSADTITGFTTSNSGTIYGIGVTTGQITGSSTIASGALATNAVSAANLATNAITLGYAQITGNITSTTSATFQNATGLSVTVTVPSGGRKVKFTFGGIVTTSAAASGAFLGLSLDGTIVQQMFINNPGSGYNINGTFIYVGTPAAGSHAYVLQFAGDATHTTTIVANTAGSSVGVAGPAFILVEAI